MNKNDFFAVIPFKGYGKAALKARAESLCTEVLILYIGKFGQAWTTSEVKRASFLLQDITSKMVRKPGLGNYYPCIREALEKTFHETEQEMKVGSISWIGSNQVTAEEFCFYSRGLFWLAAVKLLYT